MLGSINLSEFVTKDNIFDFKDFNNTVKIATIALNNILDEGLLLHPLQEQQDSARDWRQIGLGIMGLADLLIKLHIKYGSKESIELCDKIGYEMINMALYTSSELAKEQGVYPKFNLSEVKETPFFKYNADNMFKKYINESGLRNSQILTIAPTGSLSSMLGISGGIEPIFANYYTRKTESLHNKDTYYKVYTPIVEKYMKENNITDDENLPDYFITAQNLNYINRIDMQAVWQSHIDASISSTINVPNEFTIEEVLNMYLYAYGKGLKGLTMYRDGCERGGILTTEKKEDKKMSKRKELPWGTTIGADDDCIGKKRKLITGCGSLHCTAFFDPVDGRLLETYLSKGSSGGCNNFMTSLSRMISHAARTGASIESIIDQLMSSGTCPSYSVRTATKKDTSKGSCCPVAIGYALTDMYKEIKYELGLDEENIDMPKLKKQVSKIEINTKLNICPECGEESLVFEIGCQTCKSCGWTKCD